MGQRDTYRARIYEAETATPALCYRQDFTLAQAERWANGWRRAKWARKLWPAKIRRSVWVQLNARLTAWGGQAGSEGIELAPDSLDSPYLVLHELAHVIADRLKPNGPGHGPVWLGVVRLLIGKYIGRRALSDFDKQLAKRHVPIGA